VLYSVEKKVDWMGGSLVVQMVRRRVVMLVVQLDNWMADLKG